MRLIPLAATSVLGTAVMAFPATAARPPACRDLPRLCREVAGHEGSPRWEQQAPSYDKTYAAARHAHEEILRHSMPYASNDDLPPSVRSHLPPHAQDIFRAAFNNAWLRYSERAPERREEIAHRIAWSAVKRQYRKVGNRWVHSGAFA
jgi:cation transport regulator